MMLPGLEKLVWIISSSYKSAFDEENLSLFPNDRLTNANKVL